MAPSQEREIRELLVAANSGEATDLQMERLNSLICTDPAVARYCAKLLDQQASLAWQGTQHHSPEVGEEILPLPTPYFEREKIVAKERREIIRFASWPVVAASFAFLLGAAAASFFGNRATDRRQDYGPHVAAAYEAQLVRSTNCRWDHDTAGARSVGAQLTSGESLDLLEGLAGIDMSWSTGGTAEVSLEGPAAMMLSSDGMPTLRFGKLTATITTPQRPFILETSVGRVVIAEYGVIGVSAFGDDAEIHVFGGSATLDPAWNTPDRHAQPVRIVAGEAVRIQVGRDGELAMARRPAEQASFVAQVSMASDSLIVTSAYIDAVKASRPIGYWRLEGDNWPSIRNEMSDRFQLQVDGVIGRTGRPGSEAIEFGVTDRGGDVVCSEVLDASIGDSYSLEMWVKPSHYHVGAMVSLVGTPMAPSGVIPHGMLLELGGSGKIPRAVHHPGRIRFLHRSPASDDSQLGTSCYSKGAYTLRRWQHVVAVKDGDAMRLYVNGQLVGEGEDHNELPSGLRLLIGRLYPSRNIRPFIGQLDEVALYDRALTPEEINQHFHLLRPVAASPKSI
ncbi:LamG domain-containing protein [Lacipirellula sp.]|uniref:LamG domain-containing protein n=1 Tax=Lacipirellula sp. TaxID=2691419 RepID=UPI003D13663E